MNVLVLLIRNPLALPAVFLNGPFQGDIVPVFRFLVIITNYVLGHLWGLKAVEAPLFGDEGPSALLVFGKLRRIRSFVVFKLWDHR